MEDTIIPFAERFKVTLSDDVLDMLNIVVEFLCHENTTDEEIKSQVNIISKKVWIALWVMSQREWWNYRIAMSRLLSYYAPIRLEQREKEKRNEINWNRNLAIRWWVITNKEKPIVIREYGDYALVIWYPFFDQKTRNEVFKYTSIIERHSTPTLYEETRKKLWAI